MIRWNLKDRNESKSSTLIYKVCETGKVESEFHLIFSCTLYNNIRATFLQNIGTIIPNIRELNEMNQIKSFMSKNFVCLFAKLVCDVSKKAW